MPHLVSPVRCMHKNHFLIAGQGNRFRALVFHFSEKLSDVSEEHDGTVLQVPQTGNSVHFPTAEPKPPEIEIYRLNRKIAVRPPEKK